MHIHILGICGTFMGGVAILAKASGYKVTGSDENVYPPMSTQLQEQGIELFKGYDASLFDKINPDLIVVGNVMKRGMGVIERMLNEKRPYVSGPQYLYEHYLRHKTTLAVAGTHGKTSTASMLAWILEKNGLNPGFLIGGIPRNFGMSARDTKGKYFVIEADEYDCAFFDKRSKFVHYHPDIAILNNLEFDHADIFNSIDDIKRQFHHLVRTIPGNGAVIYPKDESNIQDVLDMGLWTQSYGLGDENSLHAKLLSDDASSFALYDKTEHICDISYNCTGMYNVNNALCAIKAANSVGISLYDASKALESFLLPKRRMELVGSVKNINIYDDFAHHPSAILCTSKGLRDKIGNSKRLIAIFEPRSNSMKIGANKENLADSFKYADMSFIYAPKNVHWDIDKIGLGHEKIAIIHDFDMLLNNITDYVKDGDEILIMSNGSFNGIHQKLLDKIKAKFK